MNSPHAPSRSAERPAARSPNVGEHAWFLCGSTSAGAETQHVAIDDHPFVVGRRPGISLSLRHPTVSGRHAVLWIEDEALWLRDEGSTNGTYINGQRIEAATRLSEEDLIHFAEAAFRVRRQSSTSCAEGTLAQNVCEQAAALVQFDRLMSQRLVVPHFQPIIQMHDQALVGYEVLGRGQAFGLTSVQAMFRAASQLRMEVELSQMLRFEGVRVSRHLQPCPTLFVNTHPAELASAGLIESIAALRQLAAGTNLVLEIHEAAITAPEAMRRLRDQLHAIDVGLAYDDFGAGQARLVELTSAQPDYVKFDIALVRGIDADPRRQRMLGSLVSIVRELDIVALAEGIETEAEAEVCRDLHFDMAQGFLFGRPAPADLSESGL